MCGLGGRSSVAEIDSRPGAAATTLVLITGAPGSGKTTLAGHLAPALGFPLLAKDDLKETLMDALGAPTRAESQCLGGAAYALLFHLLDELVGRVPGIIVESNFARGRAEADLAPFVTRGGGGAMVHCEAARDAIVARIEARAESAQRHPGHFDHEALPSVLARLDDGAFGPLELPLPLLRVETTTEYRPQFSEVMRFVRGNGRRIGRR